VRHYCSALVSLIGSHWPNLADDLASIGPELPDCLERTLETLLANYHSSMLVIAGLPPVSMLTAYFLRPLHVATARGLHPGGR